MIEKIVGAIAKAWCEADRRAREQALQTAKQNAIADAESTYERILEVIFEAVRIHAVNLSAFAYGVPEAYSLPDHIRINEKLQAAFIVAIRYRPPHRGERTLPLHEFKELLQEYLDEITTRWGWPRLKVERVGRLVFKEIPYWGVLLVWT